MKKVVLSLAFVAAVLVSCNKKAEDDKVKKILEKLKDNLKDV